MVDAGPPPLRAWLILATALLAVSSAGAVFEMMDGPGPLLKASWRLQATALVPLPGFIIQWRDADPALRHRCSIWNRKNLSTLISPQAIEKRPTE